MISDQEATPGAEIRPLKWPEGVEMDGAPAWVGWLIVLIGGIFVVVASVMAAAGTFKKLGWEMGGLVAAFLVAVSVLFQCGERVRRKQVREYATKELEGRDEGAVARLWEDNEKRRNVAAGVCRVIARELQWPNGWLVPGDALRVVMFDRDGLDIWLGVMWEVEQETGLKVPKWDPSVRTVGEMVDWMMGAAEKTGPAGRG